jgi:anti-sigma factor RsiW
VSPADWRALIEAYLDGRLSPEAFARRFLEGVRTAAGGPQAIADFFPIVEAFEAEAQRADGLTTNDDDMRLGASRALSALRDEPAIQQHTFDRTRAREEFRRFQVQMTGCAGIGCAIAALWVGLCVLQIYYVSEWIQAQFDWGAWPSAVLGFILAFVPIIGNVLAFLGATQEGWATWAAALVFFAAPAATLFSGWSRWRRSGR